jgi:DNA-binding MarR family transcriptional regulator
MVEVPSSPVHLSGDVLHGSEPVRAHRSELGELIASMREFSLFLTESIDALGTIEIASDAEMAVMIAVRLDGPTRPRELARSSGMTSGGVTNLLDRLETAGLSRRRDGVEGDQRGVVVELTAAGVAAVKEYARAYGRSFTVATPIVDRWRALFAALGHEVGTMKPWGTGRRSDLVRIRRLEGTGALAGAALAAATGVDDPTPWHTFHLLWLAERHEGLRPRRISAATYLSSAGTSDLLDRMEQRGLVRRATGDAPDGRATTVTATEQGRALLAAMLDALEPLLDQIADALFSN